MKLSSIFNKDSIIFNLQANSKKDVIEELLGQCIELNYLTSSQKLNSYINENEKKFNSASGRGIAYHYHTSIEVKELVGVLGVSNNGIDYDANDGLLCNYILLILEPKEQPDNHRKVINLFQEMMNEPKIKSEFIQANSKNDIENIILSWENSDDEIE